MKKFRNIANAKLLWNIICPLVIIVYTAGLFVPIMEPDAGVYAEVSMEMHLKHNYLEIFKKDGDWLDKPHFQFWITALAYKIFGVNYFAYKFFAVIFTLIAAYYTYLFGKRFYSRQHGFIAALILITAEHIFISNNDVRAEPYMTGLTIFSLYYFAIYLREKKWAQLVLGSLGLACLIMTKGLFTIVPVGAGVFFALLYERKWNEIFDWKWLVAGLLVILFMLPALYGYYIQFDLHPEKEVFGRKNVSGVMFFLWESQWGRFSNTGPIKGQGDPFFFVHTMVWAFAPWAFLGFFALYQKTRQLIKKTNTNENYTYFGFVILFLIFSVSRFQLSYYLNALFPLLAILTTAVIFGFKRNEKFLRVFSWIQLGQCILFVVALVLLHRYFLGRVMKIDVIIFLFICLSFAINIFIQKARWLKKIIFASAFVVTLVNYYLNREFYPELLKYQSESEMANYINRNQIPAAQLVCIDADVIVSDVILEKVIPQFRFEAADSLVLKGKYVFTSQRGMHVIDSLGIPFKKLESFDDYPVTQVSPNFLNRATREKTLRKNYLLKIGE